MTSPQKPSAKNQRYRITPLEAAMFSENWVREMGNRALVLESHHTIHIEGTRMTLGGCPRMAS